MSLKALQSIIACCIALSVAMVSNASTVVSPATNILAMKSRHNDPNTTQLFDQLFDDIHSFMNNNYDEIALRLVLWKNKETEHNQKHFCQWQGIFCELQNKTGRVQYKVTAIFLDEMTGYNLKGTIRYDAFMKRYNFLDEMTGLSIAYIGNDFFVNGFPPNLRSINLERNRLTGNLARYVNQDAWSNLQHLKYVRLSDNLLSHIEWNKLPKSIEELDLSHNKFSYVPIESVLASLRGKNKKLSISNNNLHGFKINWTENMLCNLETLDLRMNTLLTMEEEEFNLDGLIHTLSNASWILARQSPPQERYPLDAVKNARIYLPRKPVELDLSKIYNESSVLDLSHCGIIKYTVLHGHQI
eukprot:928388_1